MPRKIAFIAFLISSTTAATVSASFSLEELKQGSSNLKRASTEPSAPVSERPHFVSGEALQLQLSCLKKASERKLADLVVAKPLRAEFLGEIKTRTPHRSGASSGIKLMEHQRFTAFKQMLADMKALPKPNSEEERRALNAAYEGYLTQAVLRYTDALKEYLEKCRTNLSPLSPSDLDFVRSESLEFKQRVAKSFQEIGAEFKSKKTSQQYTQRDLLEGTLTSSIVKEQLEQLVYQEMKFPEAQAFIQKRKESEIEKIVSGKVKVLFDKARETWKPIFEQLTSRPLSPAFELETTGQEYNRSSHLIEARQRISEHFKESKVKGNTEISLLTLSWREATDLDKALIFGAHELEKPEETRDRTSLERLLILMDGELRSQKLTFPEKADERTIRALAPKIQAYIEEKIRNFASLGFFVRLSSQKSIQRFIPLTKLEEIPESFEIGFSIRLSQPVYYGEALYVQTCSAFSKPWMSYSTRLHTSVEASSSTYLEQGDLQLAKPHYKGHPIYLLEDFSPQETVEEIKKRILKMRELKDQKEGVKNL